MTASVRPYLRDGRPSAPPLRRNPNPPDWIIIAAVIATIAAMMHAGCGCSTSRKSSPDRYPIVVPLDPVTEEIINVRH
jgi:hypothetical protein